MCLLKSEGNVLHVLVCQPVHSMLCEEVLVSRYMASVSRNLGRSQMMVFGNTGAHTYSMKKKTFIYRHSYVHSHSMRHYGYFGIFRLV
jgi:hypothetical protein